MTIATEREDEQIDVLLLYNSADKQEVDEVYHELRHRGMNPWMDTHSLRPGENYQTQFGRAVKTARSAAVFYGKKGLGKWEREEIPAVFQAFKNSNRTLIPVYLPGVKYPDGSRDGDGASMKEDLETLVFVNDRIHVVFDWGIGDPDAYDVLEWGITGKDPRESRGLYQIQVQVPKAERSCFIACPSDGSDELYNTVCDALNDVGIQYNPSGAPSKLATPAELSCGIVSAELVIAICTPDSATERPSPETMFLLGQAVAMGKPILCITCNKTVVPALVADTAIVRFSEEDLGNGELLRERIAQGIRSVLKDLRYPFLVDPGRQDVSVAYADMLRIPPVAWEGFQTILLFGLDVDRRFREVAKHVHKLQRDIAECLDSATGIANAAVSERNWRVFRKAYGDWLATDLPLRKHFLAAGGVPVNHRIPDGFVFLEKHTRGPLQAAAKVACGYFQLVLKTICVYLTHFERFRELADRAQPSSHEDIADLSMLVYQLASDTQTVHTQTHAMMANLLGLLGKSCEGKP